MVRLLAGDLPSWLDVDFVLTWSAILAGAAVILLMVLIIMVKSLAARVLFAILLGGAVFGPLHYRQTISDCEKSGTCACKFLGEDLKGGCAAGS